MAGLIKAGQAAYDIQAFAGSREPAQPSAPTRSVVEHALDDARAEIARLQAQLIEASAAAERDASEAYAAGVADGQQATDDRVAQRLERLDAALSVAHDDWHARLAEMDTLAVQLARTTLAKLFSESRDLGDLVARAITRKVATMRSESVVAITVSASDFADAPSIEALQRHIPTEGMALVRDTALAAGTCRLDLKLGHVDLSIEALADEVDEALAGLLHKGAGA
ncbi:hypothetical protein DBR17_01175 [Sphingomonas sp. HMWF008]|nr:hypothetical protein DBR17_01175 [Sphingomonas sp. HMWF008]